jgi:class 3 adenylate cyclase
VGDLIMAIFGAPVRRDDDALAASRCAIRMVE